MSKSACLADALEQLAIELPSDQVAQLEEYCKLLWEWNKKLNLTRHTDYDRFVARDVVDTLQLAQLLDQNEEILDVGTGGGVPGLTLAIVRPDLRISLSESVKKKARAVEAITRRLDLPVAIFADRAETLLDDFRFDSLIARAVGPLWKMCFWFRDHWFAIGRLLAVKGPKWVDERAAARERGLLKDLDIRRVASYPLLGTDSESVILELRRKPASGNAR